MHTVESLTSLVNEVRDPEFGRTLKDLKVVKQVAAGQPHQVAIELPCPGYPQPERIKYEIQSAVGEPVEVKFSWTVRGKNTGGSIGLKVKNIIAVGSGKGGVGKSTVAASLAYGLKHFGATVGLMDADVYGPSIPHLVGASGQPQIQQMQTPDGRVFERILPIEVDGLRVMSMGFMVGADQAVIWRGPMLHKALSQFLQQTDWGELDYLIIDMPPGTGDVALTLSQLVGLAGAVVVCTPQQVALLDAGKAVTMFRTVKIPILGIVENMSGDIFGRGGAKAKAQTWNIPFLGEVPSTAVIRERGDEGRMSTLFSEENPARTPLLDVCSRVAVETTRQVLEGPALPTLEIL